MAITSSLAMNLPNDTNHLNNLFGGRPMEWMDVIAAISAIVITAVAGNQRTCCSRHVEK